MSTIELESIHALLDDIAQLVGAPALVEDAGHVVIAYSRHDDPGDAVRASTILHRRAAPQVAAWLAELGIADATLACRVPANPALGMRPRVCLPLRRAGQLLGYLWFIDEDMEMSSFDLEQAALSAVRLVTLISEAPAPVTDLGRTATVQAVLRGEATDDPQLDRLMDTRQESAGALRVMALQQPHQHSSSAVRVALNELARRLAPLSPLAAVIDDFGVLICAEPPGDTGLPAETDRVLQETGALDVVVGIGDPVDRLTLLPLAYRTAQDAVRCGTIWPSHGHVVDWPAAGLYRLVPLMARQQGTEGALVRRLRDMWANPEQDYLAQTAEMYLDMAGHVQETAAALVLHRTTLYQRLQRFVDLVGVDIRRGEDRTLIHLALKASHFPEYRS